MQDKEYVAQVVKGFLDLGLVESYLSAMREVAVDSFGRKPEETALLVTAYHTERDALHRFQVFLEEHTQRKGD